MNLLEVQLAVVKKMREMYPNYRASFKIKTTLIP